MVTILRIIMSEQLIGHIDFDALYYAMRQRLVLLNSRQCIASLNYWILLGFDEIFT